MANTTEMEKAYQLYKKNVMANNPRAIKTEDFVATWNAMETLFFESYDCGQAWGNISDDVSGTPIEIKVGNMVMKSYWCPAMVHSIEAVLKTLDESGYLPEEYNVADE